MMSNALGPDELARYSRHLILPEVGLEGQRRLRESSVLLVGAGGLGSPLGLYLAAAGVGRIGMVDFDRVDASNLQRQVIHGTSDIGRPKLDSARDRIRELNPHVTVEPYPVRLTSVNALEIARDYDVIIDGTDNFPTRYLVNDTCVLLGKPYVYGSVFRFEGQVSVLATPDGPCYRCLFREPPPPGMVPGCAEGGVLGVLPGLVGVIQATEAIKLLLGIGETLAGRLLLVDALTMRFRTLTLARDPECPACGTRELTHLIDYEQFCGITPEPNGMPHDLGDLTPPELAQKIERKDDFDLIDVRETHEWNMGRLPGARHIPLGDLPDSLDSLDPEREIVLYCRSGGRSARAKAFLQSSGFRGARNLLGGILRWGDEVDPSIPRF
ncbi:MAG TPA: molybdopterin-synthase adenylyltransferase MoeB [Gemmatimonadales bacterium]|nr:molybdopterin-synthase adenylyltransferase MoeB [Gemmatimonadales bacterium]